MASKKRLGIVIVPREIPKDTAILNMHDETFKEVIDKIRDKDKDKNQVQDKDQNQDKDEDQDQDKK